MSKCEIPPVSSICVFRCRLHQGAVGPRAGRAPAPRRVDGGGEDRPAGKTQAGRQLQDSAAHQREQGVQEHRGQAVREDQCFPDHRHLVVEGAVSGCHHDDDDDDGDEEKMPSCSDYVMHFFTIFWKVIFAFIPPTGQRIQSACHNPKGGKVLRTTNTSPHLCANGALCSIKSASCFSIVKGTKAAILGKAFAFCWIIVNGFCRRYLRLWVWFISGKGDFQSFKPANG
ncbi:hypothetical protein CEXT_243901 [Caerostris extrusa]|uniref:Uncharacterized protein n=1 Tax=Caerostris extrusa TaxID=172846 RepID=A0AAV4RPE2_CAEEX|nr:hypothetical protein CEXT_243901 [Caerostris extrusa]